MDACKAAQSFRACEKPLTAETAEIAEKKTLGILGELCVLGGKTAQGLVPEKLLIFLLLQIVGQLDVIVGDLLDLIEALPLIVFRDLVVLE